MERNPSGEGDPEVYKEYSARNHYEQRQFSEHTMELIDAEVTTILNDAAARALSLLEEKRDDLEKVTRNLLENEELDEAELIELIGPSVHPVDEEHDDPEPLSPATSTPTEPTPDVEGRKAGRTPVDFESDQ